MQGPSLFQLPRNFEHIRNNQVTGHPRQMIYRAEIDGLRAVAVLLVIFFHFDIGPLKGGFVGVDIFFVISGYLITNLILSEIRGNCFSAANFYERRARRLLPALFLVMLVCIPFAWKAMLPDELENFGQSLVATTLFANNILLSLTAGYWDLASEYKPLLHTWSLGIEEQFYFVLPLFFALVLRLSKEIIKPILLAIFAFSLAIAIVGTHVAPLINFYSPFSRVWEFVIGGCLASACLRKLDCSGDYRDFASLLGVIMIFLSAWIFDSQTPHPGPYTLVPAIGTALILLFANTECRIGKILGSKFFVYAGLVSYSAYLWHVPIWSFLKIYDAIPVTLVGRFGWVAFVFLLSYLTYQFVEKPFRNQKQIPLRFFTVILLPLGVFLVSAGAAMERTDGFPLRIFESKEIADINTHEKKLKSISEFPKASGVAAHENRVKVFVSGDSYAADVAYLLEYLYGNRIRIVLSDLSACDVLKLRDSHQDPLAYSDIVVFAFDEGHDERCSLALISVAESVGKQIFLFGTKHFGSNLNWIARLDPRHRNSLCQAPNVDYQRRDFKEKATFSSLNYISIFDWISNNGCVYVTTPEGNLISSDRKHLTIAGVKYLADVGLKKSQFDVVLRSYFDQKKQKEIP